MNWKHGKDSKAPLLDKPKPMQYHVAKRKAELWDSWNQGQEAILAAANEIEKAHKAGESREALTSHIATVAAHLADSNKVSHDEAIKLIHGQIQSDLDTTSWRERPVLDEGFIRRLFEGDNKNPYKVKQS
jgi:hypothetical protein